MPFADPSSHLHLPLEGALSGAWSSMPLSVPSGNFLIDTSRVVSPR